MKMIAVSSSNIKSIGYENGYLYVRFLENRTYKYFHVPKAIFQELLNAPSKGKYLDMHIKGHFPFQPLS